MADAYTMEVRLCDDDGMVSDERVEPGSPGTLFDPDLTYRKLLNNLRARSRNADHRGPYEGEPFPCTGSAHVAGEHVRCTSPAHNLPVSNWVAYDTVAHGTVGLLSPAGSAIVCANGYCHICGDSLLATQGELFCNRCQESRDYTRAFPRESQPTPEAQDDRRWTIFRTIGNSDDNILAGPVVAVGESVEVVPAEQLQGAVEALQFFADGGTYEDGGKVRAVPWPLQVRAREALANLRGGRYDDSAASPRESQPTPEAQDDRRWTIFRTIGNSDDNILAGPVVAVGESVEVVPAEQLQGAVEALQFFADGGTYEDGGKVRAVPWPLQVRAREALANLRGGRYDDSAASPRQRLSEEDR